MTLDEFLAQPEISVLSDTDALAQAQAYEETKLWRIEGAVRKTQVETVLIVQDTYARWDAEVAANDKPAEYYALMKACRSAFQNIYKPEFYINLNDPTVSGMYTNAVAYGILNAAEAAEILAAASYTTQPFSSATLTDVKAARNPATWVSATHGDGAMDYVVSVSSSDIFNFVTTLTEDTSTIKLRFSWRETGEHSWKLDNTYTLTLKGGSAAQELAQQIKRFAGISQARHFKFEYLAEYDGQVNGVVVSVGR